MKKEVEIQKEIMEYLWEKGIFCWRNNTTGMFDPSIGRVRKPSKYDMPGVSDVLGIYKGRFLAIEVKSAKGKLTENQSKFIDEVIKNGGYAFMARSVEDVELMLGKMFDLTLKAFKDEQHASKAKKEIG